MQHFPYHIRYRLYAKWKNVSYSKNPLLMVTKAETIHTSRLESKLSIIYYLLLNEIAIVKLNSYFIDFCEINCYLFLLICTL